MSPELAKELKDTGFPMNKPRSATEDHAVYVGTTGAILLRALEIDGDWYYTPTLEELIEACGEGFETLSRDTSTEKVCWIANNYHDADAPEEKVLGWYEGSTPLEAVARLWLALNTNGNQGKTQG